MVARADHRGVRRRGDRLSGEDQVLRLPDHPGARGDGARRADPADRAGDGGRRRRDRDAVPALPSLARRLAVEAEGSDRARLRDADPPPLAARRRRRRARGVGAEVQAARRLGRAGPREAPESDARHRLVVGIAAVAALVAAYGWFEAGWVRLRVLELRAAGPAARARRAAHRASVGLPSRRPVTRRRAVERAVDWVAERRPDLVCVTGDLLSRPRGEPQLLALLARLPSSVRRARQPRLRHLARPVLAAGRARTRSSTGRCCSTRPVVVELRGRRVELAGVDPRSWLGEAGQRLRATSDADLRILLCHFPRALDAVPAGRWDLILAGHLHAGQIVLPYGFGKLLLAHPTARYSARRLPRAAARRCTSRPGLGTTFVPFRFFARPEATELVLRSRQ